MKWYQDEPPNLAQAPSRLREIEQGSGRIRLLVPPCPYNNTTGPAHGTGCPRVSADLEIGSHETNSWDQYRHGHTQTDSYWAGATGLLILTRPLILDPPAHGCSAICRPGRDSGKLADESPRGQRITIMYDQCWRIGQRPTAVPSTPATLMTREPGLWVMA